MYDFENPVMRWVSRVILVLCVLFAAFSIFTAIMGVKQAKAQALQYAEDYKKIAAEIEELQAKKDGMIGDTITAQDLGAAIAKDQNVLSKYAEKMYKETISGEESAAVKDRLDDLALKLGYVTSRNEEDRTVYFDKVWTKNPKAEVRFETVLKYYTESIDCLFTIWDGDNLYGYVTGKYDEQSGCISDIVVTFTPYGQKNEPVYNLEEDNNTNSGDIQVPEGASYTADEIRAIMNKDPDDRTEDEWNTLKKYWDDTDTRNNNEDDSNANPDAAE